MDDTKNNAQPVEETGASPELADERALLRTLLAHSPDYIFFKDRQSRFILTNEAHAQELLGLDSAAEAVGKTDFDLFAEEEAQRFFDEEQQIMDTQQPVIAREWSLTSSSTDETAWVSEHKVPITDEHGNVIGLMGISRDITDLKLVESEREQLLSALEHRTAQLQTAAEVSSAASSILEPNELIRKVVDLIGERFGLYYVGLFLLDESETSAVLRAGTGEAGQQMVKQRHRLKVGSRSMIGQCVAKGEAQIAQDVAGSASFHRNPLLPKTRSELALPLLSRGKAIGALTIQSTEMDAFSEEDITILQAMAVQVTNAIESARLIKDTQNALEELQAIQRRYVRESWSSYLDRDSS
jgi:PAS domain S-box-containing protein